MIDIELCKRCINWLDGSCVLNENSPFGPACEDNEEFDEYDYEDD